MKKLLLLCLITLFLLTACAVDNPTLPDEPGITDPAPEALADDDPITPAPEPQEPPDWVLWLADHWGGDAEKWMGYAAAENKDIASWLWNHPLYAPQAEYNFAAKQWDPHQQAICTLLPIRSEPMPATDDINKLTAIAEELVLQLLDAYCVGDERWSFQFIDYKFNGVTLDWLEEWRGDFWCVGTSFDATYNGFIDMRGPVETPGETYVSLHPLFELVYGDGAYTIIPIYYDGSRDRYCGC